MAQTYLTDEQLRAVRLEAVTDELRQAGWTQEGGQAGRYSRWRSTNEKTSLIVPLDVDAGDYLELLREALSLFVVAEGSNQSLLQLFDAIHGSPTDRLLWAKDTIGGQTRVAWPVGKQLVDAAEKTLLSAAKARLSHSAYYGNKHGIFARRFLNACMMGQTEVGSYVVTALAPRTQVFPESETADPKKAAVAASYTGREITETLIASLETTTAAIDHLRNTDSLSGFEEGVRKGVSKEFTEAIALMLVGKTDAHVEVQLDAEGQAPDFRSFEFQSSLQEPLMRATRFLETREPNVTVTITGYVNVLARPKRGEPGIVRLHVQRGSEASTVRVRLSEEQFKDAADAVTGDTPLTVRGRQEKERSSYWLYDPVIVRAPL